MQRRDNLYESLLILVALSSFASVAANSLNDFRTDALKFELGTTSCSCSCLKITTRCGRFWYLRNIEIYRGDGGLLSCGANRPRDNPYVSNSPQLEVRGRSYCFSFAISALYTTTPCSPFYGPLLTFYGKIFTKNGFNVDIPRHFTCRVPPLHRQPLNSQLPSPTTASSLRSLARKTLFKMALPP